MEITTTKGAWSGVCQTAVTTRQQLVKLPDTKARTNGEKAVIAGRGGRGWWWGGVECKMSHFTFATFAFDPLQSSESFWEALLVAD